MQFNTLLLAGVMLFASICSADNVDIYKEQGLDDATAKKLADFDTAEQEALTLQRMVASKPGLPIVFTLQQAAEYNTLLSEREKGKKVLDKPILYKGPHIAVTDPKAPIVDQIASYENAMPQQLARLTAEKSSYEAKFGKWDPKTESFADEEDLVDAIKNAATAADKEAATKRLGAILSAKQTMIEDDEAMKTLDYMYGLKVKYDPKKGVLGWFKSKLNLNEGEKIKEAEKADLEDLAKKRSNKFDVPEDLPTRQRAYGIVSRPLKFEKSPSSGSDTSASSDEDQKTLDDIEAPIDPYGPPSDRTPENTDLDELLKEKSVPADLADSFKPAMDKIKLDQEKSSIISEVKSLTDIKGDLSADQKQKLNDLVGKVKRLNDGSDEQRSFLKELDGIVKNGNKEVAESFDSSFDAEHILGADGAVVHDGSFTDGLGEEFEKVVKNLGF